MSQPFLGQIMLIPYNFAPYEWAYCDGSLLSISQNTALFSLLGTFYGGNGASTFALPNLQGCVVVGQGQGTGLSPYVVGETGGSSLITLLQNNLPSHNHTIPASATAGHGSVPGTTVALGSGGRGSPPLYATPSANGASEVTMSGAECGSIGGSQPHNNLMPYLVLSYVIAMAGIFPTRS
jgi:microcystin-dependent protein